MQKTTLVLIQVVAKSNADSSQSPIVRDVFLSARAGPECHGSWVKSRKARPSEARGNRAFLIEYWAGSGHDWLV